MNYVNSSVGI